jgi:hypothetical protein
MKKVFTRLTVFILSATLLLPSLFLTGTAEAAPTFKDVPANHWAAKIIDEAVAKGIVVGFSDGTFRPDDIVSSDQLLVMLFNSFKSTHTSNGNTVTEWDQNWLRHLGNDVPYMFDSFNNGEAISRFEFKGASSGYWAKPYVDFAYAIKYLDSFDRVYPHDYSVFQKPVTRERASYLFGEWLYKYEGPFDDQYIQFATDHVDVADLKDFTPNPISMHKMDVMLAGIMRGWNNHFYPQRYLTRAEALTMVLKIRDTQLRTPFKPDLTGQYYTDVNGRIWMFSDKTKFDYYGKFTTMANDLVKTGYVDRGSLGVAVYKSKQEASDRAYFMKIGHFDEAPLPEFSVAVGSGSGKYIAIGYGPDHNFPNGGKLFDAVLDVFSDGKGAELKSRMFDAESKASDVPVDITVNGRKFKFSRIGSTSFNLEYYY